MTSIANSTTASIAPKARGDAGRGSDADAMRGAAGKVAVLDLRDPSDDGVRVTWNRPTRDVVIQFVSGHTVVYERLCRNVDDRQMFDLMTTPRSVAWAVRDDAEMGCTYVNFHDGEAEVPSAGLKMSLDLRNPSSNEEIWCEFAVEGDGDDLGCDLSFGISRHYLLGATQSLEYLVLA